MRSIIKLFIICVSVSILPINLLSQDTIVGGQVNSYLKVDSVLGDRIKYHDGYDIADFQQGDLVMLYQASGYKYDYAADNVLADYVSINNTGAGTYELLAIAFIYPAQNIIEFTAEIKGAFVSGEAIQLIKVCKHTENIIVDSKITAPAWNGEVGGVVAFFSLQNLVLNADIDVSGLGFRGAIPDHNQYTGGVIGLVDNDLRYDTLEFQKAALKGEGGMSKLSPYVNEVRGSGKGALGGGGGAGLYSGGAGGGHADEGGDGGRQFNSSTNLRAGGGGSDTGPFGLMNEYIQNRNGDFINFGGGGGTSTQNLDSGRVATAGGNGGGIVIILADSIIGNNHVINAHGDSVTDVATAGGGGGGGGGAIFIESNGVRTNLILLIAGGKGGDANGFCTGSGGGGGGGIVGLSFDDLVGKPVFTDTQIGSSKGAANCPEQEGRNGNPGDALFGIELPLNGYYFNAVKGADTLCKGQDPAPFIGTQPKGGGGKFKYYWQASNDKINWVFVGDTINMSDSLVFDTNYIDTTTYFRRFVVSERNNNADTSKFIEIKVYEPIEVGSIASSDTICYGGLVTPFSGPAATAGGDEINYQYTWQWSNDESNWNNIAATSLPQDYDPGPLFETTFIRRRVTSGGVCQDISDTLLVKVWQTIIDNDPIESLQVLCSGQEGDTIQMKNISGGDSNYYEFQWLESYDQSSWDTVPSGNMPEYYPGTMTDSVFYKRIVRSGIEHGCIDTSSVHAKIVLPVITNNNLTNTYERICAGEVPPTITGLTPGNGDGIYHYQWQSRTYSSGWTDLTNDTLLNFTTQSSYEDTTFLRRIVRSGLNDVCEDISDSLELIVVPHIQSQIEAVDDSLCYNQIPDLFIGYKATGGDNLAYKYQWQRKGFEQSSWDNISSANDTLYQSESLTQSYFFRRLDSSDICYNYTDTIEITVFDKVTQNEIANGLIDSTCFQTPIELAGLEPQGGLTDDYRYLWQKNFGDGNWVDAPGDNTQKVFVTEILEDSAYYRRIFTSGLEDQCIDTTEVTLIRINPLPYGDIIPANDSICEGDTITFSWDVHGAEPFTLVLWDGNQFIRANNKLPNEQLIYIPDGDAIYTLDSLVDRYGCVANDTNYSDSVIIDMFSIPVAKAGQDLEFCGLNYNLGATLDADTGYWITTFDTLTEAEKIVPNLSGTAGMYGQGEFIWYERNGVCSDTDTMLLTLYEQPNDVEFAENVNLNFEFTTTLEAPEPNAGEGVWHVHIGKGDFVDSTSYITDVNNLSYGRNEISWTVSNGVCDIISDTLLVNVNQLAIPTGFSPNGDGINEEFIVTSMTGGDIEIVIFNRWGNVVYESKAYGADGNFWEGKSPNGEELPADTYFYIIKVSGRDDQDRRGYIELRR